MLDLLSATLEVDRQRVEETDQLGKQRDAMWHLGETYLDVGGVMLWRHLDGAQHAMSGALPSPGSPGASGASASSGSSGSSGSIGSSGCFLLRSLMARHVCSLARAVAAGWPVLLVGVSDTGKTSLVHLLATLLGRQLVQISLTAATDAIDLLGSYEQVAAAHPTFSQPYFTFTYPQYVHT